MTLGAADLHKLWPSILLAVLMFAVAAVLAQVSNGSMESARIVRLAATADQKEADGKLKRVRDDAGEIKEKSIVFNKLHERGMIGEEQRLDWVELLKELREKWRLADLQYEIEPQRQLDGKASSDFAFAASAMKLRMHLLHEGDLLGLLGDLRRQAKALILIRSCKVERLPASAEERGSGWANLLAECEIDWLTLRARGPK